MPLAAIVCKGTLARRSLNPLDEMLAEREDDWVVRYARGMNHLHWPRALRHSADAVADFERCLELQLQEDETRSYFERTYILLGDAHAKNKSYDDARGVWIDGLKRFPGSAAITARMAIEGDDALLDYILDQRSLEQPIDTDFSFVDASFD